LFVVCFGILFVVCCNLTFCKYRRGQNRYSDTSWWWLLARLEIHVFFLISI